MISNSIISSVFISFHSILTDFLVYHLFVYGPHYPHLISFNILQSITIIIYFDVPVRTPYWLLCFAKESSSLRHIQTFCYKKILQAHLVLFLPQPWSQIFLCRDLAPFITNWFLETNTFKLDNFIATRYKIFF